MLLADDAEPCLADRPLIALVKPLAGDFAVVIRLRLAMADVADSVATASDEHAIPFASF